MLGIETHTTTYESVQRHHDITDDYTCVADLFSTYTHSVSSLEQFGVEWIHMW